MGYRIMADAVMLLHFAFLAFVVLGGFLAWRWPRLLWTHAAAAGWGFATVVLSLRCPLTDVEEWARSRAGQARLRGSGFIDHYIEGVLYPEQYTALLQALAALAVVVSWVGVAVRRRSSRFA
jgi:Protein of Unknown function (DUF2784)